MPVYMPFEIQAEIIRRLPIKSLIQFRSVSKPWKSLIDSSEFIASYSLRPTRPQNLLVCYVDREDSEIRCVSIVDDDTFPQQKFSLSVPMSVKRIENPEILGSSQGLLCLYNMNGNPRDSGTAVLWNPIIRKAVVVDVPNVLDGPYKTTVGFGVCLHTSDPKLVKITYRRCLGEIDTISIASIPWQVEVFTLSSGAWRSLSINLPQKSIELSWNQVVLDRFIYWLGYDRISMDTGFQWHYVIMSFDMTSEEFTELRLPDSLAVAQSDLVIYKLRESLVLLESIISEMHVYGVWMMENVVPNSFTKLFTFTLDVPDLSVGMVLGFTKSGEPLTVLLDDFDDHFEDALYVYERFSKHINYIGISAKAFSCLASSYTETLLLLDH